MALKELALNWLMQQDKQRLANELKSKRQLALAQIDDKICWDLSPIPSYKFGLFVFFSYGQPERRQNIV